MKENETQLSFCIWNFFDISHQELTDLLGINPSKVHIKGERVNPKFSKLASENGWLLDSPAGIEVDFEQQMNSLLDLLEPRAGELAIICNKYYCEFSLAVNLYSYGSSLPSIHLSKRYHSFANKLNLEFDIDLYCLD